MALVGQARTRGTSGEIFLSQSLSASARLSPPPRARRGAPSSMGATAATVGRIAAALQGRARAAGRQRRPAPAPARPLAAPPAPAQAESARAEPARAEPAQGPAEELA